MTHPSQSPTTFDPPKISNVGTLADRVTAVLLEKIKGGEFPVGTRLPTEQVISERLGVSRTVVREAISRLKSDGLVEVRQGSGTMVRAPNRTTAFRMEIDPKDTVDAVIRVNELRRGIEAEAAALAAQRRTRAQLADIKRALAAIDTATKGKQDGVDEDLAFHKAVSRATGNPLYPSLLEFISQFIHAAIRLTRTNESRREDFSTQVRSEHRAIYDAISAQDPEAARRAALTHIDNAGKRIQEADPTFWEGVGSAAAQPLINEEKKAARRASRD